MRKLASLAIILTLTMVLFTGCGKPEATPEEMLTQSMEYLMETYRAEAESTATMNITIDKEKLMELIQQNSEDPTEVAMIGAMLPANISLEMDFIAKYNEDDMYFTGDIVFQGDLAAQLAAFGTKFDLGYFMSKEHGFYFKSEALSNLMMLFGGMPSEDLPADMDLSQWTEIMPKEEAQALFEQQEMWRDEEMISKFLQVLKVASHEKQDDGRYLLNVEMDMNALFELVMDTVEEENEATLNEMRKAFEMAGDMFIYDFEYVVREDKEAESFVIDECNGTMTLNPDAELWDQEEIKETGFSPDIINFNIEFAAKYSNIGGDVNAIPSDFNN